MLPPTDPDQVPTESTEPTSGTAPIEAAPLEPAAPSPTAPPTTAPRRRRTWGRRAVLATALVTTFVVGIGIGGVATSALNADPAISNPDGSTTEFGLIREAWDTIHSQYVARDTLDDRELIWGAIDGMTQAVGDTGHTSFMTPEERAERSRDLSGSYVGIGIRIEPAEDGRPRIVGVFDGSPAAAAGLLVGDVIESVDGEPTAGKPMDQVATLVRGEAGTEVTVVVRAGDDEPRTYTITRADVPIASVSWTLVPGSKTALLRLESFSTGSADDVVAALKEILAAGTDRLVLDIRGNPGGYVNEAVGIASQFLKDGVVFVERDASGHETTHPVSPDGVAPDLPLIVLVDAGSASSSEILAGALQDHGRASIEGVTTFGTGTVLGEFPLSDGSALRIGTVEWLTPDGRRIWHEGIEPDVTVERPADVAPLTPDGVRTLTPAEVAEIKDPQLARALTLVASAK